MFSTDPSAKGRPTLALRRDLQGALADSRCLSRKSVLFARDLFRTTKWTVWHACTLRALSCSYNKQRSKSTSSSNKTAHSKTATRTSWLPNYDSLHSGCGWKKWIRQLACVSVYWVTKWIHMKWLVRAGVQRCRHVAGRNTHTHTRTDNTWPYRSRASLTSSFALECVVARTLL